MNYSFIRVPIYCAVFLPKCITKNLYGISLKDEINRTLIPSLTIIGVLLPMRAIPQMRGMLSKCMPLGATSTMATRTTIIRQITIMLGVLEPESKYKKVHGV